jgi:hypothetical protein
VISWQQFLQYSSFPPHAAEIAASGSYFLPPNTAAEFSRPKAGILPSLIMQ